MIENYLEKIKQRLKVVVLHAVIYTRYSSDNQRSESIDAQIRLIRKWAQEYNIIIDKVYADEAQSAKRDDRQQFQQMIADSKKQKDWQLVLVHKLDRFARNRMDSAAYRVELRKNKKYLILSNFFMLANSPLSFSLLLICSFILFCNFMSLFVSSSFVLFWVLEFFI